MTVTAQMRGHAVYHDGTVWRHTDDHSLAPASGGQERPCTRTETLLPPPAIPDATLEPLLDDRERACEVTDCEPRRPASWAATWTCGPCGTSLTLICEQCRREARQYPFECDDCGDAALLMHAERL